MDHGSIQDQSVIERYRRGELSEDEERRFEEHLLECTWCQEELAAERGIARGMKLVAAEEATRAAVRRGVLARLARRGGPLTWVGLAVFALGLAAGHLLRPPSPPSPLAAPRADVPVVLLGVLRSDDGGPVALAAPGGPWLIAVDAGLDPRITTYSLSVLDNAGTERFESRDLQPNALEVIQLLVPAGFLDPGDYQVVLRGTLPGGRSLELGRHALRLVPAG